MRIALVTSEYITERNFDGGLANYVHRTALALLELGHDPNVFVLSDLNETLHLKEGVTVHRVEFNEAPFISKYWLETRIKATPYLLSRSWKINRVLRKIHKQSPFSIVQYPNLGGIGLFKMADIPSVTRISSYTPLINKAYGYSPGYIQNFWETCAMKLADNIFCPSVLIAEVVMKKTGLCVKVIESPFVIDTKELDEKLYNENLSGKKYLLFFGTIGILKGVHTIAQVIPTILEKYKDLHFVFIGKQSELRYNGLDMMDWVMKNAGNFKNRVHYFQKMHHDQLYPFVKNALAVVLPSRIDNFPNTCLEAMAFKRIVIGTYGTSFEQLITDNISGFLCKIDDPESLLNAIEKSIHLTDDQRYEFGLLAENRIKSLNPYRVTTELVSFYEETIQKRSERNR